MSNLRLLLGLEPFKKFVVGGGGGWWWVFESDYIVKYEFTFGLVNNYYYCSQIKHTCILYLLTCNFAFLHTWLLAYLYTWFLDYLHTCIPANPHTCLNAYLHSCITNTSSRISLLFHKFCSFSPPSGGIWKGVCSQVLRHSCQLLLNKF